MFSPDDTIVAIATPEGRGGIGVVRISGPDAAAVAARLMRRQRPLEPRRATFARIVAGPAADQVVVTWFPSPRSYTGEDVVEVSAHGSPVLLRAIVRAAVEAGARLAEPGEFTFRAYLHGRIDLIQAEAVRDLVDAVTPLQARAAFDQLEGTLTERIREADATLFDLAARLEASLDFPEEGYHFVEPGALAGEISRVARQLADLHESASRGRLIREGAQVVIVGRPNVGKSSVFNALSGAARAIVTDVPGTTRDLLTEKADIDGVPITFVDTAGIRASAADAIEAEGIARAEAARSVAALVLVVLDRSRPLTDEDWRLVEGAGSRVVIANKIDLAPAWDLSGLPVPAVPVSATTGAGLSDLRQAVLRTLGGDEGRRDTPAVTNLRHAELIGAALRALERAHDAALAGTPEEFVLSDINEARARLEEVTGRRTADDVLHAIFESFCIGK